MATPDALPLRALLALVALLSAGCSGDKTAKIQPELALDKTALDFGTLRVGSSGKLELGVRTATAGALTIQSMSLEDDLAGAFAIASAPTSVEPDSSATVAVLFAPKSEGEAMASLVIRSDDPEQPVTKVSLQGRGGNPHARLVPECKAPCTLFTAQADPSQIDFGARRPLKQVQPSWPTVAILNDGDLPLTLSRIRFTGDAAFSAVEALDVSGVSIDQGGGQLLHVRFNPGLGQASYQGTLVVESDDPDHPQLEVALRGTLAPGSPPTACAAIVEVDEPDGSVFYPMTGGAKDFAGAQPQVEPGKLAQVYLSAFSDHFVPGLHPNEATQGDQKLCSTDADDGRQGIKFHWDLTARPALSRATLSGADTAEPTLRPDAIGHYLITLTVTDTDANTASAQVAFDAMPRRDLVAQLTWDQRQVDLDLHLVKPAGAACKVSADCVFDPFGDLNGFSAKRPSAAFDWGQPGPTDDPRLDLDDRGDGALLETITLDLPEHDAACVASGSCSYGLYVHYFEDWRVGAPVSCPGKPCSQGKACGCSPGELCNSDRCTAPARPRVDVWLKPKPGDPPTQSFELAVPESLAGPCFLWHAADVVWSAIPAVQAPANSGALYYGKLDPGTLQCAPNYPQSQPVDYLPGTPASY